MGLNSGDVEASCGTNKRSEKHLRAKLLRALLTNNRIL